MYPPMLRAMLRAGLVAALLVPAPAVWAQGRPAEVAANQVSSDASKPSRATSDYLVLYFDSGSTVVRAQDRPLLDKAARLYRDAHPVIMIVSGGADSVGTPLSNLTVSEARAKSVFRELVGRGIPADRFQLLAKGVTDQQVHVSDGIAEQGNRSVEIRWR